MNTEFWLESPKGRGRSEDVDVDVRTILKYVLRSSNERAVPGCCEHGNEPSGSIGVQKFLV
jgi:hypothetical protein